VVSNPRDDRLGYNNAPSCADYPLCELIDRGNVDGINCRFVSHALPDRSVNAGLAAIISADKPVVNWSFPFVDAPAKDALINTDALVGSSAEISKWIILGIVSQLKLISNFINV